MSGVGHLIGIPPPNMAAALGRPPPPPLLPPPPPPTTPPPAPKSTLEASETSKSKETSERTENGSQQTTNVPSKAGSDRSSVEVKPPMTLENRDTLDQTGTERLVSQANKASDSFIDIPSLKARIMHPNRDISLEELRLELRKYDRFSKLRLSEDQLEGNP